MFWWGVLCGMVLGYLLLIALFRLCDWWSYAECDADIDDDII